MLVGDDGNNTFVIAVAVYIYVVDFNIRRVAYYRDVILGGDIVGDNIDTGDIYPVIV